MEHFNLTYQHLTETNKQVKALYDSYDKAQKKIQKSLGRKYKSKETNALDGMIVFNETMELLPSHLSAISKEHENKVAELKKAWIPKTDASLGDAKLAVEYLDGLSVGDKYQVLREQHELRSLFAKYIGTFGESQNRQTAEMIEEVFNDVHSEELAPTKNAVEALEDLKVSFEHKLREQFNEIGGFTVAQRVYDSFLDDKELDEMSEPKEPEKEEVA